MSRFREEMRIAGLAVQFLTRLPVPDPGWSQERMAATPRWYPAVGALVGALSGLIFLIAVHIFPPALAAVLATAAGILITGAFHEDGLADSADGLGGGTTREKSLEIMRDSRLGTYGTLALVLILMAKVGALTAMPFVAPFALIAAHSVSRWSTLWVMVRMEYARDHGTGKPVAAGIGPGGLVFAGLCAALAMVPLALSVGAVAVLVAVVGAALGHWAMRARFSRKLGGYTGDTLGAVQQLSEIGFYLGLLAWL
ncbi:MAG: adenosylcobinamide-GDP ribazoletransferase [Pseudomonadota bacterium]